MDTFEKFIHEDNSGGVGVFFQTVISICKYEATFRLYQILIKDLLGFSDLVLYGSCCWQSYKEN